MTQQDFGEFPLVLDVCQVMEYANNDVHLIRSACNDLGSLQDCAGALQIAADVGARRILIPVADIMHYSKVPTDLISRFSLDGYSAPVEAAFKALSIR